MSRFVVLDFYLSPMPETNAVLNVFRKDQKVGELKISGPTIGHNTVADVLAGEAAVGDTVRAQ